MLGLDLVACFRPVCVLHCRFLCGIKTGLLLVGIFIWVTLLEEYSLLLLEECIPKCYSSGVKRKLGSTIVQYNLLDIETLSDCV